MDLPKALGRSDEPVLIGMSSLCPNREFDGQIDEVAIFARALDRRGNCRDVRGREPGQSVRETHEQ